MSSRRSDPEFPGTCPNCGSPVVYRGVGRRPIWCSTRCRNDAALRRLGARIGAIEVRIVEVPRPGTSTKPRDTDAVTNRSSTFTHNERAAGSSSPDQAVQTIRNNPEAVGALLVHLERRRLRGKLADPEWLTVRNGIRLIARELSLQIERPSEALRTPDGHQPPP